ncbi:MAG: rhodanese-like domain-containing protein [Brevinematales bacterium]|nr:rhodanese-like domain-containing protein [Brevinematales bacterium]
MKKLADVVIDLRSSSEFNRDLPLYKSSGMEAVNIDFFKAPKEIDNLNKEKSYVVVCESGLLSGVIAQLMVSKGFRNVFNIQNGIEELRKILNER